MDRAHKCENKIELMVSFSYIFCRLTLFVLENVDVWIHQQQTLVAIVLTENKSLVT